MATGTLYHYDSFWVDVLSGLIDLSSGGDALKISLHSDSYTPDRDAHNRFDDLTNEASGSGYVSGGDTLAGQSVTKDGTNHRAIFDATNHTWPSASVTFRYAAVRQFNPTNIRSATYKWTASGGGVNEYYCELDGGGDPSLADPDLVEIDGAFADEGAAGSLAAGEWDYGDNDALGYSTVYVRLSDGADPDGKASAFVQHSMKSDDRLIFYVDYGANQAYSAQNVVVDWNATGVFGGGGT